MCLLIDANVASVVFRSPATPDYAPIFDWLQRDGCLVYGGKLADELDRMGRPSRYLQELKRAGRAILEAPRDVADEERKVVATRLCKSDDPHVIALARVSGARVLCTDDKRLIADFREPKLVSRPRGKVYRGERHAHLLRHSTSCPKAHRRRRRRRCR